MFDTMTLKEMQQYLGRQEVPHDFDAFWDEQLMKVKKIPKYQLEFCDFQIPNVDTYELRFMGTNESSIYAKCLVPKYKQPCPVIFYFHGYQGQGPDWSQCLNYVAVGYAVVAMDVRGQAGKSMDHSIFDGITVKGQVIRGMMQLPDQLFYKDIYLDVYQLIEVISEQEWADSDLFMAYGGSQGGALALVAGALNHRISKVVSIYPFLSDFKRILELGDAAEPYNELFRYFKFKDPFHQTEELILNNLAYIDVKNFSHRIRGEVYLFVGMQDDICPPSTQFAIYNRMTCQKKIQILQEYGHEGMNVLVNDCIFNWLVGTKISTTVE